jgi:phosphatidylglycerophosphate synthase
MQAILSIPESRGGLDAAEQLLFRKVAGVPLLIRAIATASRAGADEVLLIFSGFIPCEIVQRVRENKILSAGPLITCTSVPGFDPASASAWQQISSRLQEEFFWIPWNWVTNKHALVALRLLEYEPATWTVPSRLKRDAVMNCTEFLCSKGRAEGIAILSEDGVDNAERWLVANSGKPLDGIYTSFNRRLCRPAVRALTHTAISPNAVTLAGLLVACVSAYFFSRGSYLFSVIGALLFFLSGLFDEIDGMLARIKFSDSAFGTWFEGSVDNLSYLLLFVGIAVGLSRHRGPRELWIGGVVLGGAILSVAVISWLRKRSTQPQRPNEYLGKLYRLLDEDRGNWISRVSRHIEFLLKKGVFIHYVLLFSLLGLLPVMMRIAAIAANLTWILALYFKRRFFRGPRPAAEAVAFQKTAKVNL